MTEKVIFNKNLQSYFSANGLTRFDDFFEFKDGQIVNQNSRRNVMKLDLSDGGNTKTFYMKRFFNPHFKDMLFTLCNFGKLLSQAELEWRNANILLENGIETYHPVCYGVQSVCGIERQSFFITENINGSCLLDYLIQHWKNLSLEKKEGLVIKLAVFFAKIHAARLSLPDAYIWHVYMVNTEIKDYEFGMIDLHRMKQHTRGNHDATMNLGRFFFSLPDGFMDADIELLFFETYLKKRIQVNPKTFVNHVKKWKRKLLKRRKKGTNSLPTIESP